MIARSRSDDPAGPGPRSPWPLGRRRPGPRAIRSTPMAIRGTPTTASSAPRCTRTTRPCPARPVLNGEPLITRPRANSFQQLRRRAGRRRLRRPASPAGTPPPSLPYYQAYRQYEPGIQPGLSAQRHGRQRRVRGPAEAAATQAYAKAIDREGPGQAGPDCSARLEQDSARPPGPPSTRAATAAGRRGQPADARSRRPHRRPRRPDPSTPARRATVRPAPSPTRPARADGPGAAPGTRVPGHRPRARRPPPARARGRAGRPPTPRPSRSRRPADRDRSPDRAESPTL